MNQLHLLSFRTANYVADAVLFSCAFLLALLIIREGHFVDPFLLNVIPLNRAQAIFLGLAFYGSNFFALAYLGAYSSSRMRSFQAVAEIYMSAVVLGLFVIVVLDSLYPYIDAPWLLLPIASTLSFVLLLAKEALMRRMLRSLRRRGMYLKRALFVGSTLEIFERVREECAHDPLVGLELTGFVGVSEGEGALGNVRDIGELIDEHGIGAVICMADEVEGELLILLLQECEIRGVQVFLKLSILDGYLNRTTVTNLVGHNFLTLHGGPKDNAALLLKYVFDRMASVLLLVVLSPLLLLIGFAVRLSSEGPVLFRQLRTGQDGKPFWCLKFRTMNVGAENEQDELLPFNEMEGPVFKMAHDPRVTPFGRLLRRSSLDELPQLWNVLCGTMSLVGPRPLPVQEARKLSAWQRRRLRMKPGITGVWQVSGRSEIRDFNEWVELDLEYIDHWSFRLDLKLLLRTVVVVFFGRGAR